jgi:DNA-binding transcriptional ArsR family regulator
MLTIIKRVLARSLGAGGKSESELDRVLSALAHGVRRSIVNQLRYGPASAGELARPHALSLPAISRHLRVLENAGLVRRRIDRRVHHIELVTRTLKPVDEWLAQYKSFWVESLDSLARYFGEEASDRPLPRKARKPSGRRR